ncbi:DUF6551 family protein [Rhodococcus koreensis]
MTYSHPVHDAYIDVVPVGLMFRDPTYQRELDQRRVQRMSYNWDRRLVGVVDVCDRGEQHDPRYAIINGQHRWAAAVEAGIHNMAVNIHTGLTPTEEARLFFDIDAKTKQLSTWDRWHARSAAGDPAVRDIEKIADKCGLTVRQDPGAKSLQCCAALERIWKRFGPEYLANTLVLLQDVWPGEEYATKAVIVEGTATLLYAYDIQIQSGRLADAMTELSPKLLHTRARELQEAGSKGSFPRLVARVLLSAYNRQPGRGKLDPGELM